MLPQKIVKIGVIYQNNKGAITWEVAGRVCRLPASNESSNEEGNRD